MFKRFAAVVAAGVLVATGMAAGPAHAAASPTVTATPECGKVTITVNNPTSADNLRLQYQADRGLVRTVQVAPGTTVRTVDFPEDSGRHWVRWRLWGGPERDWDNPTWVVGDFTDFDARGFQGRWAETLRVDSDCRPNFVRADSPTVVQPECGAERGKVVVPSKRGVVYKVRSGNRPYRAVRAGEYPARPGVYWVRAEARDGYRLAGQDRWRLTVEESEACPTPTPTPTDEPTVTPSPTVSPTTEPTEPPAEPTEEPAEEPEPAPTVTETRNRVIVVNNIPVPSRVDTGLGGLAAK